MAARRMGIIGFLFCLCLYLMPCGAQAVSTASAAEPISTQTECSLTLSYAHNGTAFSGVPVKLYRIAAVSAEAQYTLAPPFLSSGLVLNGVQAAAEWNAIRSTLESHILANAIGADFAAVTDQTGRVCFESLEPGLYLATADRAVRDGLQCSFVPALVALPGLGADGRWQYQVSAASKAEVTPPGRPDDPVPDQEIQFKILKLWKGDGGQPDRPQSIEAEIFKDGKSDRIVTLSEENHWSYAWTAKEDGSDWMVVERNVPEGYSVTVEERTATFVLTNTRTEEPPTGENPPEGPPTGETPPEDPTPGGEGPEDSYLEDLFPEDVPLGDMTFPDEELPLDVLPATGDTPHILLYAVLMYVSGIALILFGITGKRKRV